MSKTKVKAKKPAKAPVVSTPDDKTEQYSETLRVELTLSEIADRADRAAQLIADRDAKDEEHKAAAKHSKSVIESIEAEIRRLSNEVRTKATYRKLTEAERQMELPFETNGDGAE